MIKQTAYICTFYDCLSKYLTDNSSDITGFLKEWDNRIHEKSIHSDGDGGIRFLTIHKSKGLEYDHVIMPYCDWQLEKSQHYLVHTARSSIQRASTGTYRFQC